MARRFKSLERSRRTPVLTRPAAGRALPPPAAIESGEEVTDWAALAADAPGPPDTTASAPPPPAPTTPRPQSLPSPGGHAPTGWDWFAQWSFPTQFFLFALVIAAGMWWMDPPAPVSSTNAPAPPASSATNRQARLRPETFDWLNRLRETQVVTDELEAEFAKAQQFYREYALDEFLDFDPWSLGTDEVITLTHFCEQGFFTVEREILIKILERKIIDTDDGAQAAPRGATARLQAAARDRESRLASLREAADLYRRGRSAEVALPGSLTPEDDQARRASLVDKLAGVRRERERLDTRIAELNGLLR